ncbi:L-rhamnose-binding lectin CSL3-like [Oculina patagonica]
MRMRSILVAFVFTLVLSEIHCLDITVCEGDEHKISCDGYQKINIVAADYGRSETGVCKDLLDIDWDTNCHSPSALDITKEECQDFPSCNVYANNDEYGNPCFGIKKYLTVSYDCLKTKPNVLRKVRVCQGDQQTIECPSGRKLDIEYAMYGRLKGGHVCGGIVLDTNCQAGNSLAVVQSDCQGERSCLLQANDDMFGDPCWGTKKYLEVHYRCRKA